MSAASNISGQRDEALDHAHGQGDEALDHAHVQGDEALDHAQATAQARSSQLTTQGGYHS